MATTGQAIASSEGLRKLSTDCQTALDNFNSIKSDMDQILGDVLTRWRDPVGQAFLSRYKDYIDPIKEKMIPALNRYVAHLQEEANIVEEFNQSF